MFPGCHLCHKDHCSVFLVDSQTWGHPWWLLSSCRGVKWFKEGRCLWVQQHFSSWFLVPAVAACPPCGPAWWSCSPVHYKYCSCVPRALCRDGVQHCLSWSDEYLCRPWGLGTKKRWAWQGVSCTVTSCCATTLEALAQAGPGEQLQQACSRDGCCAAGIPVLQAGHQLWDTSVGSPEHVHLLALWGCRVAAWCLMSSCWTEMCYSAVRKWKRRETKALAALEQQAMENQELLPGHRMTWDLLGLLLCQCRRPNQLPSQHPRDKGTDMLLKCKKAVVFLCSFENLVCVWNINPRFTVPGPKKNHWALFFLQPCQVIDLQK